MLVEYDDVRYSARKNLMHRFAVTQIPAEVSFSSPAVVYHNCHTTS
jgi:hypothetical protein